VALTKRSGESLGHSLARCRYEDVQSGVYLTDGADLIRVIARDGGIVWWEDVLDPVDAPPSRTQVTTICRSFRVVQPLEHE